MLLREATGSRQDIFFFRHFHSIFDSLESQLNICIYLSETMFSLCHKAISQIW